MMNDMRSASLIAPALPSLASLAAGNAMVLDAPVSQLAWHEDA